MASEESAQQATRPLNFGKRLAHTDKTVRDKGFKNLKSWLQKNPDLLRLDYMKLWKGLYFAMWMADKRPVQQELSVNIALLLKDIPAEKQVVWMDAFWETLEAGWEKLDTHRMNKYLLFARIVVAEFFQALRLREWPAADVKAAADTFTRSTANALHGTNVRSLGLMLQFTRIFWDELTPQLDKAPKASAETVLALAVPFLTLSERSHSEGLVRSIHEHILRKAPEIIREQIGKIALESTGKKLPIKNQKAMRDTARELGHTPEGEEPVERAPKEKRDYTKKLRGKKGKLANGILKKKKQKIGKTVKAGDGNGGVADAKTGQVPKQKKSKAGGKAKAGAESAPVSKAVAAAAASKAQKNKRKYKAAKEKQASLTRRANPKKAAAKAAAQAAKAKPEGAVKKEGKLKKKVGLKKKVKKVVKKAKASKEA